MKAIMLCFDSLNRHFLSAYGCDWTHTPNFKRLAERCATFNRAYCCSMPCMPARRELHTGRPNFLHNPWGMLQPYDDSAITMLRDHNVHTHLASDHYHYWEENAANYHTRFNTWEFFRGQEGDPWIGHVGAFDEPEHINGKGRPQDWINRMYITAEPDWSLVQTIDAGLDYMRRNRDEDNWFLQIECFDPHEPFFAPEAYLDYYPDLAKDYDGPLFDWPPYNKTDGYSDIQIEAIRKRYAALLTMCDKHLGRFLDAMDEMNLWDETMLVVWTDHGHLLGEHGWFAKNSPPWWEELSHIPLWIWDPRSPAAAGQRRDSLVQTIDLAPTLLGAFGIEPTARMTGVDLANVIADDTGGREAGLFGGFGHYVNCTDGRYVLMKAPVREDGGPLHDYTLHPVRYRGAARAGNFAYESVEPFDYMCGTRPLRVPVQGRGGTAYEMGDLLYDLAADPQQKSPINDENIKSRMTSLMVQLMQQCDAPAEQYDRIGVEAPVS